jgi:hypothetical protein
VLLQILTSYDLSMLFQQSSKYTEWLVLEPNAVAVLANFTRPQVYLKCSKVSKLGRTMGLRNFCQDDLHMIRGVYHPHNSSARV